MPETEKREPVVWLDGVSLPASEALVPALTPGWLQGFGLFETIGVREGRPFALERHLRRLERGAGRLGLPPPPPEVLRGAVRSVIEENRLTEALVRVTVSAAGVPAPGAPPSVQVLAHSRPLPDASKPLKLASVPWRRNEFSVLGGLKTVCYAENSLALEWARRRGAEEALFLNTSGDVCEGSATNLFLVRNGQVITPWLDSGCLPGVTRGLVLEICGKTGVPCVERAVTPADVAAAEEAFVTSSGRGAQPVEAVDGIVFRRAPGPVTVALRRELANLWKNTSEP